MDLTQSQEPSMEEHEVHEAHEVVELEAIEHALQGEVIIF